MAKRRGSHSHVVKRMKTFDERHKGKKAKLAVLDPKTNAGQGTPWPLSFPFTKKGGNAGGLL